MKIMFNLKLNNTPAMSIASAYYATSITLSNNK